MQKIAIAVLSVMVLALAAMNARHEQRERILEERLAAMPKRKPAAPVVPEAAPVAEAPTLAPVAVPELIATPVTPEAQDKVVLAEKMNPLPSNAEVVYTSFALSPDSGAFKASFTLTPSDSDLNLTDAQRSAIDRLREVQAAQSQEIERAIRNLMTPEQLQVYDGRLGVQRVLIAQTEESSPVTGLKAGYLGVQGNDATGGGAEVTSVLDGTAASAFGLKTGDVILEVNGEPIPGLSGLSQTIRRTGEGFAANLRIRRAGVEFLQGVQLGGASK